jgi:hypothetical protein
MLFANIGLPMIFVELPFLVIALAPVVVLESIVYRWALPVTWTESLSGAFRANLLSTFVGVPLAWFVQVVAQVLLGGGAMWGLDTPLLELAAVTVQSAWLIPYADEFVWMVPAASLFLMLPCFLVSVVVERLLLRRIWPAIPPERLNRVVALANAVSYTVLSGYWAFQLVSGRGFA